MTKQELCATIAQMIRDEEYIASHDVTAKDGAELQLVTFGKDYMLIINKNESIFTFRLKGKLSSLKMKNEELQTITEEYKAKEEERLEQLRLAKLEEDRKKLDKWREQRDSLDAKIREVEEAEKQAYGGMPGTETVQEQEPKDIVLTKQGLLQKIFGTKKEE